MIRIQNKKKLFPFSYFLDFPTNVSIQIVIKNIHSLNEINMVSILIESIKNNNKPNKHLLHEKKFFFYTKDYSMDIILRQKWEDMRLKFEHFKTTSLELDQKMIEKIWVPDSFFPQEKQAKIHEVTVPNRLLHIYENGTVVYSMR